MNESYGFKEFGVKTFGSSDELLFSAVLHSVLSCDFCGLTWNMGKRKEGQKYQLQSAVKLCAKNCAGGSREICVANKRQNVCCANYSYKKSLDALPSSFPGWLGRGYMFINFSVEKCHSVLLGIKLKKLLRSYSILLIELHFL